MSDSNRKTELNRDLSSYIASKRKSSFSLKGIFTGSQQSENTASMHPEVKPYESKEEEKEVPSMDDEAVEELEEEYAEESKGFFSKLKGLFKPEKEPEDSEEDVEELANPELKELARITLTVLKKLPGQELREFKNSEDFAKFKDILARNNLIK